MFFNLIHNSLIKDEAYDYMLSLCDSVSFLYVDYSNKSNFKIDVQFSDYNYICQYLTNEKEGESWEMKGREYTFNLSDTMKELIKTISIYGKLKITNQSQLENLQLIKDNKIVYSICTHEGYEEIDEKFEKQISQFCLKEISKTGIYKKLYDKISYLQLSDINQIDKHFKILRDLDSYVSEAWNCVIYAPPTIDATYEDYLQLANKYLTTETNEDLKEFTSFKELFPSGYPTTFEELPLFDSSKTFINSFLYKQIMEEVDIASAVIYNLLQIEL